MPPPQPVARSAPPEVHHRLSPPPLCATTSLVAAASQVLCRNPGSGAIDGPAPLLACFLPRDSITQEDNVRNSASARVSALFFYLRVHCAGDSCCLSCLLPIFAVPSGFMEAFLKTFSGAPAKVIFERCVAYCR